MQKLYLQVKAFMLESEQRVGKEPGDITRGAVKLGTDLIKKRLSEFTEAVGVEGPEQLPAIATTLGNLIYVVAWNGVAWGLPMAEIMDEIHRVNMEKLTGEETHPLDIKSILDKHA